MPVGYVAPGPIGFAGSYGRGGGGNGFGPGGVIQIQDDTARQQNQLAAIGLQGRIENDQINQRGQIQAALGQQAASLDVWQYQQKVTEQEAMQLRQDQNAIAAIDSDPTMSPLEKMQNKTRIKTRVDWVSERQKRDMQQAQVEMYQAHAAQYKQQADLDEQRMVNSAALLQNKTRTLVDPTKGEQIREIISDSGVNPDSPEGVKMIDRVAAEHGWVAVYPVTEKGGAGTKPIFGFGAEGGTHDAPRGSKAPVEDRGMSYSEAHKSALAEQSHLKDENGNPKPIDPAKLKERANEIMNDANAHTPAGQEAVRKEAQQKSLTAIPGMVEEIQTLPYLDQQTRQHGTHLIGQLENLMKKYGHLAKVPASIDRRADQLRKELAGIRRYSQSQQQAAEMLKGQQQQPAQQQASPQQQAAAAPSDVTRTDRPVFTNQITPAEAVGNAARNAWGAVVSSAPDRRSFYEGMNAFGRFIGAAPRE